MDINIRELHTVEEWTHSFEVMKALRTDLSLESYLSLRQVMTQEGYQLFGLYAKGELVSLAGIRVCTNLYNGRHVFIYDLVTSPDHRSHGYGERLLTYIHDYGREQGAALVALESGVKRNDAHRFYEERMGYTRRSYSFRKEI